MAKRIKKISEEEFREIQSREWHPVKLEGDAIPEFLKGIPANKVHSIVASGTCLPGMIYHDKIIPSGQLIGGIDVYRNAPDDPVELNKDWYAVVRCSDSDSYFMVSGPIKDDEHWIDEIPARLQGAEVLGVPKAQDQEEKAK
jgi:hypothetical protein